jgi:phage terminase large subunit
VSRADLDLLDSWKHNIPKFAWDNFRVHLEPWSAEVARAAIASPKSRVAMQAAVGVGKSFTMAIVGWHFLATNGDQCKYPGKFPNGIALSITGDNLKSGLWKELGVWYGVSPFLQSQFDFTAEQITHKQHPLNWWLRARSFPKSANGDQQGASLSGLHSPWTLVLLDEVGDMHPNLGRRAEQVLSDADCERGLILAAGNPTSVSGLLYDIATAGAGWQVVRITGDPDDPQRSKRVDLGWASEQVAKHGRDNPWVQAHILGQFPPGGLNTLISPDEVRAAQGRSPHPDSYEWAQKRLGVDVARFGDDRTVLFPRQGVCAFPPIEMRHADTNYIAARVLDIVAKWGAEVVIIDDTGHWGHGVLDNLLAAGINTIPVQFHDKKVVNPIYFNRRTEMLMECAAWVKSRGALPKVPELVREMPAATFYFHEGKQRVIEKDDIKELIGVSPDYFDALALTFAIPDQPGGFTVDEAIASGVVRGYTAAGRRKAEHHSGRIVTDDDVWQDGVSRF